MTENEKIAFLQNKVIELNKITKEIAEQFPEKSFSLDGILLGNIVEVMTAHAYGITLYPQSEKTHDGEAAGRKVQIKGTQKVGNIDIKYEPDFLIVEFLDKCTGCIYEIYNGPGSKVWKHTRYLKSSNEHTIQVRKLLELDAEVSAEERINHVVSVKKFIECDKSAAKAIGTKNKNNGGKSLHIGFINKNMQENMGCLNKPGTHYNQQAYKMRCQNCNFEYEANGCDVAIRKCPKCM